MLVFRNHISLQDLECFLPPEKAANALSVLDIDGDGKVSMSDMRDAVVSIYHDRTNLASTLKVTLANKAWLIESTSAPSSLTGCPYSNLSRSGGKWRQMQ